MVAGAVSTGATAVAAASLSTQLPCLGDGRRAGNAAIAAAFGLCGAAAPPINVTAACGGRRTLLLPVDLAVPAAAVPAAAAGAASGGVGYVVTVTLVLQMARSDLTAAKQARIFCSQNWFDLS